MTIDLKTLTLIIGLTHLIQVLIFYHQFRVNKAYNGIGWWLLWSASETIGFLFLLLRDIPGIFPLVVIVQNCSFVGGTVFIYIGLMRFFGKKENLKLVLSFFTAFLLSFCYFLFIDDNITIRGLILSLTISIIAFFTAHALQKNKIKSISATVNFNTAILILHGGVFIYRSVMILYGTPVTDFFTPTFFSIIPYFDALLVSLLWTFGFIIMVNQRLNTEISEAKKHLESQNEKLERLHRLNQKIFSVISHDFKGPILSLQLLLKSLEKNIGIQDHYLNISNQLTQANHVLDNLLNWAKTELNIKTSLNLTCQPFSIANEISAQLKSMADQKGILIVNNLEENISLKIPPDILRIVFRNLISNAIKFSYEKSKIEIQYQKETNQLKIVDSGVGIGEEKLRQLFKRNTEPSLGTWHEAGFGLGLFISHELLERFESRIRASANFPSGTIFIVQIPVADNLNNARDSTD